jgi:hypothetical protein
VYELVLTPKQAETLVARVVIAMDAETQVPLRVQAFSTEMTDPAFEIGFTSVDFAKPDADIFVFTPPPGADVTEHSAADVDGAMNHSGSKAGDTVQPTVVGDGWSQVVVAALPAPDAADPSAGVEELPAGATDALALIQALPRISGDWGSGQVLAGTLFSAIVTDDGRIAVGAVTPETLGAALAAG